MELPRERVDHIIELALQEDISHGDPTSEALIPRGLEGRALILAKEKGRLAGIEVAQRVFQKVDPWLKIDVLIADGAEINPGDIIAAVNGKVAGILEAERVALNFLQRLSGIASQTARYVAEIQGLAVKIVDTRKTTPGLRLLEKYAVRMGGGQNHRMHLGDAVLIKDNHLAALRARGMTLGEIVKKAVQDTPHGLTVEVEVNTVEEALEAVEAGADVIMLDNMSTDEMSRAVSRISGRAKVEASGGITLDNVREVAMTGVDIISIGALTHSTKSLDISLELHL